MEILCQDERSLLGLVWYRNFQKVYNEHSDSPWQFRRKKEKIPQKLKLSQQKPTDKKETFKLNECRSVVTLI